MASMIEPGARSGESRETGWVNRLFTREGSTPEYQELKFTLHRKLLDRINLEALSSMAGERVRAEIRAAVAKLVEEGRTPRGRIVAPGGRPTARRFARQRRDSAGRGGRPAALDPPFRPPCPEGRGSGFQAGIDRGHAGTLTGLRQGAP